MLAKFITQMLSNKPCTIFGDGEQSRDFTYIENAVNANLLLVRPLGKRSAKVFNVATGSRFSLNETFRLLTNIIGYRQEPQYAAPRAGDVKHSLAEISRTHEAIGYQPSVNFENSLRRTVDWYRAVPALISAEGL